MFPFKLKHPSCEKFDKITVANPIVVSEDEDEALILTEVIVPIIMLDQPRSEEESNQLADDTVDFIFVLSASKNNCSI